MNEDPKIEINYVRIDYIKQKFDIEKASIYNYIKKGIIPVGKRVSHKRTVWNQQEVDNAYEKFINSEYTRVAS